MRSVRRRVLVLDEIPERDALDTERQAAIDPEQSARRRSSKPQLRSESDCLSRAAAPALRLSPSLRDVRSVHLAPPLCSSRGPTSLNAAIAAHAAREKRDAARETAERDAARGMAIERDAARATAIKRDAARAKATRRRSGGGRRVAVECERRAAVGRGRGQRLVVAPGGDAVPRADCNRERHVH